LKEQREDSRLEREQVRLDASRERTETRGQFAQSLKDVVADFGSRVETSNDRVEAWMRDLTNEMRAQRGLPPRPPEGAT
jgi:hypothetical protein